MLKKKWIEPMMTVQKIELAKLGDVSSLSDAELKIRLEDAGYRFSEKAPVYFSSPNYMVRKIAGEAVLVSVGAGVVDFCGIINLNETAEALWEKLQQGATKEELVQRLTEKFAVSEAKAREDVEDSIKVLLERGMISCE